MVNNTITDDDIVRILYVYNPWWQQKPIPHSRLKSFKRHEHARLAEQIKSESIMAIIGARRVGKTTLLYQIIDMLLGQQCKTDPASILFVSMDDPYLFMSQENFEKMLNVYITRILKKDGLDSLAAGQRVYIILDEIQGLENWQSILKRWFDIRYDVKFIITGSSSAGILDSSSESLTGRITYNAIYPMSFAEFTEFKRQDKLAKPLKKIVKKMPMILQNAAKAKDIRVLYDELVLAKNKILPYENIVKTMLDEYIIKGGYPENMHIDDVTICAGNLSTYLNLTIYKDAMRIRGARDPASLESLFTIIAKESSSVFSRTNVSKTLGISRSATLNPYLTVLRDTYMISEAPFYSKSVTKSTRKESKMYVNDVGIRNATCSMLDFQSLTDATETGKMAETVAADHTRRMMGQTGMHGGRARVSYWHEGYEVDMVAELPQAAIPIEVKYRENVSMSDLKGLKRFEKRFGAPIMIAITRNQLELKNNIMLVPMWLYLLMC